VVDGFGKGKVSGDGKARDFAQGEGVKVCGEGFRFLVHSFVRLSTKNVTLALGELLQKLVSPVDMRVLYFRNS